MTAIIKATATAAQWDITSERGVIPQSIKGIGTNKIEVDEYIKLSEILPAVPMCDSLGRTLADGDDLTIVESADGVINIYVPNFDETININVDGVVDIENEETTRDGVFETADPVIGRGRVRVLGWIWQRPKHPTQNEPGLNFDGGYLNITRMEAQVSTDSTNRLDEVGSRYRFKVVAAWQWEETYGDGYLYPTKGFFDYAERDRYYAKINKYYQSPVIRTREATGVNFIKID